MPKLRLVHYPPGEHQALHAHAHGSLSLLLAGRVIERVGRVEWQARPGQWCLKEVGVEHTTTFGPEGASTLQLSTGGEQAWAVGRAWQWGSCAAVTELLWSLLGAGSLDAPQEGLLDLQALLQAEAPPARPPPWWPHAYEALCEGLQPIGAVAESCGVHRAQLVRVTQQQAGCAPVALRQRARLGRCLAQMARQVQQPQQLRRAGLNLGELAAAHGFADQAHLNRECRRWLGQAPGRWQQRWLLPDAASRDQTCAAR